MKRAKYKLNNWYYFTDTKVSELHWIRLYFQVAGIELPIDSCNVERSRSLNPRGVFVTTVIVITFHPKFITKIDRAYRIQCFYMEADKSVSAQLEVSEMTTVFQTQVVPMPVCRYEV